jgi:hypothetical protein
MKRLFLAVAVFLTVSMIAALTGVGTTRAWAQNSSASKSTAKSAPDDAQEEPGHAYRLDFTVNEMEDGKKINSRQYSMNMTSGENEMKIGSRVPVEVKEGEFQYIDVGTSLWCRLRDRKDETWLGDDVMLTVRSELSNFASPDQEATARPRPIIRQLKIDAHTIAIVGKPLIVGVVDDPNSKRQFQLEVTVTKLR